MRKLDVAAKVLLIVSAVNLSLLPPRAEAASKPKSPTGMSTGSIELIDAGGLKFFINDNITFTTTSSASGAAEEASYTHAVAASTMNGGTVASTLNDAFDGYNTLCVSLNGATGACETGNSNWTIYNKNGPPTIECGARQVVFPNKTIGNLTVSRKVYVPTDDTFARWANIITNNGGTAQLVTVATGNNLGSDANTVIDSSSNGNAVAEVTDTWVTTFQNYSGTTSSDPRLGHVLQGPGASVGVSAINFANGDDNPWWDYVFTLQPGQTVIIVNFVTGQPSRAAARSVAARLAANFSGTATECLSAQEIAETLNFQGQAAPPPAVRAPAVSSRGLVALAAALLCAAAFTLSDRRRRA